MNSRGLDMAGTMNRPPEGTGEPIPHIIDRPPPTAAPVEQDRTTRTRSPAAMGMTPSVIMHTPMGMAMPMLLRSWAV